MQPRREFDGARLSDLADSIRRYGVLQPLVVTRKEIETDFGTTVEYELVAGERRLRAARLANLPHVPAIIRDDIEDKIKLELAIIENLQREDLNPIERAAAFRKLMDEFKLKHHEVAARVGKSREYVSNTVRLLAMPEEMQVSLARGEIVEGHCRPILMLSDRKEEQMKLYKDIIEKKINVREAERISRSIAFERARKNDHIPDPQMKLMEQKLSNNWGTRVQIEKKGDRGRIYIDFFSDDELNGFIQKVLNSALNEAIAEKENDLTPDADELGVGVDELDGDIELGAGLAAEIEEIKNESVEEPRFF